MLLGFVSLQRYFSFFPPPGESNHFCSMIFCHFYCIGLDPYLCLASQLPRSWFVPRRFQHWNFVSLFTQDANKCERELGLHVYIPEREGRVLESGPISLLVVDSSFVSLVLNYGVLCFLYLLNHLMATECSAFFTYLIIWWLRSAKCVNHAYRDFNFNLHLSNNVILEDDSQIKKLFVLFF